MKARPIFKNHPSSAFSGLCLAAALFLSDAAAAESRHDNPPAPAVSNIKIFGRFIYDYAHANGRKTLFDVDDDQLRTARIGVTGKLLGRHKFKAELVTDGSGDLYLTDVTLDIDPNFKGVKLRIGHFKTPNSLIEETSGRFESTHERPAFTDAFQFNRRLGVQVSKKTPDYFLALGAFARNLEDNDTFGGYAIAGRAAYMPVSNDHLKIQTGVSFRYRSVDQDQSQIRYRQRPVIHNSGRIIGTERIANSDFFTGVEAALTHKNFWTTGEYAIIAADCNACLSNPVFSGGFIEAGVMIGGRRVLKVEKFDRPEIDRSIKDGGIGAFSLIARFDTLDLNDAAIDGGSYNSVVFGGDWWPTDHARISVNAFIVDADLGVTGAGLDSALAAAIASGLDHETVTGLNLRLQFDF